MPYLAAGIGGLRLEPDSGSSDDSFLMNAGGGLKCFLSDWMALRGDARYVNTFDGTYSNLIYTFSFDFLLGGKKKAIVAAPLDSDGDGVYDYLDHCPDKSKDLEVDQNKCPIMQEQQVSINLISSSIPKRLI